MTPDLAVDAIRAIKLRSAGYKIFTAAIPAAITPKNRLLMGAHAVNPPDSMEIRQLVP